MLRTAQSLPLAGPLTLGFDPDRFQTEPPVCYRASWQLPGPDSHRQATTSTNNKTTPLSHEVTSLFRWTHERPRLTLSTTYFRRKAVILVWPSDRCPP